MARILTALVLVPLVVVLLFSGLFWLVSVATAAVAMLACWEYLGLTDGTGVRICPTRLRCWRVGNIWA